MKKVNLENKRFTRLKVLYDTGKRRRNRVVWKCQCDCGNITEVTTDNLKQKNVKSCGCLKRELLIEKNKKHCNSKSRAYTAYYNMKDRCLNEKK